MTTSAVILAEGCQCKVLGHFLRTQQRSLAIAQNENFRFNLEEVTQAPVVAQKPSDQKCIGLRLRIYAINHRLRLLLEEELPVLPPTISKNWFVHSNRSQVKISLVLRRSLAIPAIAVHRLLRV